MIKKDKKKYSSTTIEFHSLLQDSLHQHYENIRRRQTLRSILTVALYEYLLRVDPNCGVKEINKEELV